LPLNVILSTPPPNKTIHFRESYFLQFTSSLPRGGFLSGLPTKIYAYLSFYSCYMSCQSHSFIKHRRSEYECGIVNDLLHLSYFHLLNYTSHLIHHVSVMTQAISHFLVQTLLRPI
jgi:hypothetical protein